jgi:hypothetical protein
MKIIYLIWRSIFITNSNMMFGFQRHNK